jgi:hypothetical protein
VILGKYSHAQQINQAPPTRGEVEVEIRKLKDQLQLLENKLIDKTAPFQSDPGLENKACREMILLEHEYTRNKSEILAQITYWENILISIESAEEMGMKVPVENKGEITDDKFLNSGKKQKKMLVNRQDLDALPVEKRSKILGSPDLYEIVN